MVAALRSYVNPVVYMSISKWEHMVRVCVWLMDSMRKEALMVSPPQFPPVGPMTINIGNNLITALLSAQDSAIQKGDG